MNKNTIAIVSVLAVGVLSFAAVMTPFVYAQPLPPADESETQTEQEIRQKNPTAYFQYEQQFCYRLLSL